MSMQDPISDLLTRIRNALHMGHKKIALPSSRQKIALVTVLKDEGYIEHYEVTKEHSHSTLTVYLKYYQNKPVITGLKRVSKPGLRVYKSYKDLPKTWGGFGISVVSTPIGVLCDRVARQNKIGGEVWCQVW